jgi:HD-GYP domain-containing protein (c-di-GMP phosphodiesterase class II)
LDGSGYPDGLQGDQIELPARILAVADAFEAMTSARAYQHTRSFAEAIAELRRCAGTQFDPRVVAAMETLYAAGQMSDTPEAPAAAPPRAQQEPCAAELV